MCVGFQKEILALESRKLQLEADTVTLKEKIYMLSESEIQLRKILAEKELI